MKYPKQQFETLTQCLKKLAVHIDVKESNPHTLHYIIYQQFSEGQSHNWLYCLPGGAIQRANKISSEQMKDAEKLFSESITFELYPEGCNDTHIETAVKKAVKQIYNN